MWKTGLEYLFESKKYLGIKRKIEDNEKQNRVVGR